MANTAVQPSQAGVASVCDITGLDQAQAVTLLKKWPNWQDAVTHYFEDSSAALREAAASTQWGAQDNISCR